MRVRRSRVEMFTEVGKDIAVMVVVDGGGHARGGG